MEHNLWSMSHAWTLPSWSKLVVLVETFRKVGSSENFISANISAFLAANLVYADSKEQFQVYIWEWVSTEKKFKELHFKNV